MRTLLRPEASTLRLTYALVANLFIGLVGAMWLARRFVRAGLATPAQLGFRRAQHAVVALIVAAIAGFAVYALQQPPTLTPVVMLNGFAQVLVVSIAEVLVCWVVLTAGLTRFVRAKNRVTQLIVGLVVSAVLFGAYHYAHSPPFNTFRMVTLLAAVGLVTGLFFLVSRDVYATIVFHNFLALLGVLQAVDRAGALQAFTHPQLPLIAMATLASVVLVVLHRLWLRPKASEAFTASVAGSAPAA
jgi:hypothetical protein